MQTHNVGTTNLVVTYYKPTKAQMQAAASYIDSYTATQVKTGNIDLMQTQFLKLISNNTWGKMSFPASYGKQLSDSFGGLMTLGQLQAELNNVTAADRQALSAYVTKYGMASLLYSAATLLNGMGAEPGVHSKAWLDVNNKIRNTYIQLGLQPPVDVPHAWLDGCAAVGTALMIFGGPVGEAIGGGMLIGAALGALYIDVYGG